MDYAKEILEEQKVLLTDEIRHANGSELVELNKRRDSVTDTLNKLNISVAMPCFEFSSKATKYIENSDENIIAVDTDGISLQNDNLPHKAYTLEEGVEYTVKLYKA